MSTFPSPHYYLLENDGPGNTAARNAGRRCNRRRGLRVGEKIRGTWFGCADRCILLDVPDGSVLTEEPGPSRTGGAEIRVAQGVPSKGPVDFRCCTSSGLGKVQTVQ